MELLYRHLTTTPLKIDIVGLLWLFETFRMQSVQRAHSGKGIEIPQNVSSQVMNRRAAYSASHMGPRKIPDYPKNFVNSMKKN